MRCKLCVHISNLSVTLHELTTNQVIKIRLEVFIFYCAFNWINVAAYILFYNPYCLEKKMFCLKALMLGLQLSLSNYKGNFLIILNNTKINMHFKLTTFAQYNISNLIKML